MRKMIMGLALLVGAVSPLSAQQSTGWWFDVDSPVTIASNTIAIPNTNNAVQVFASCNLNRWNVGLMFTVAVESVQVRYGSFRQHPLSVRTTSDTGRTLLVLEGNDFTYSLIKDSSLVLSVPHRGTRRTVVVGMSPQERTTLANMFTSCSNQDRRF